MDISAETLKTHYERSPQDWYDCIESTIKNLELPESEKERIFDNIEALKFSTHQREQQIYYNAKRHDEHVFKWTQKFADHLLSTFEHYTGTHISIADRNQINSEIDNIMTTNTIHEGLGFPIFPPLEELADNELKIVEPNQP